MGGCRFGIPAGSEPEGFARAKRRSADSSPARRHGRQRAMLAALPVCLPPCLKRLPLLFPKISLRCDFREPCNNPFRGFGGFPIYQKRRHPCGCRRFCMPAGSEPEGFVRAKRRSAEGTPLGVSADSQIHPKRQPPVWVAALLYARLVLRTRRVRASEATLRRLVAGKAPWQAARYACRLACLFPKISLRCDFREP